MKKIVLLLLLCASMAYAQDTASDKSQISSDGNLKKPENKLLTQKDFKIADGRMVVTEIPCQVTNGNLIHRFVVSVVCLQNAFNEIGIEKINEIILFANKKAQATIDHEQNYLPTEIKMAYNPAIKDWSLTNLFSTKDKNGNMNAKLLSMDFDSTGKFLVMKKIF